jgi:uncharacterized protein with HEPN domain
MSETTSDYLRDILDYLEHVEQFTSEGREVFLQDQKTQFAVMRAYEVIGEIVKRLPASLLATQPQINWQTLRRFRDFLAHNYDDLNLVTIWSAVEALLAELADDESESE